MSPVLEVSGLTTEFRTRTGVLRAADNVSFSVNAGETLAIVGESGCGKSVTALSVIRLVPNPPGRVIAGTVQLGDVDLLRLSESEMRKVRGGQVAMIFQEPMTALNPLMTIGRQVAEMVHRHTSVSHRVARERAIEMLAHVRIPEPARRARDYPHQLSGGMRQRAMIAMALACRPRVLIADEPVSALDVSVQATILNLLASLRAELGLSLLLISHNLAVVRHLCDRVAVMYLGRIVEVAPTEELFSDPRHPYTRALLGSITKLGSKEPIYAIPGQPPNLARLPPGCAFHPRCPDAITPCATQEPVETRFGPDWTARCWLATKQPAKEEYDSARA